MKETKKAGRNIVFGVLAQAAGIAISLLYIILLPRQLGPEKWGQFSYWISLGFVLSAVLDFGISFYSRYIPEFRTKEPNPSCLEIKNKFRLFISRLIYGKNLGWFGIVGRRGT